MPADIIGLNDEQKLCMCKQTPDLWTVTSAAESVCKNFLIFDSDNLTARCGDVDRWQAVCKVQVDTKNSCSSN